MNPNKIVSKTCTSFGIIAEMNLRWLSWLCAAMAVSLQPLVVARECRWTGEAISIDGKADEAVWKRADWVAGYKQLGTAGRPKTLTKVALLWDAEALYFFAEMEDNDIWADVTEHDGQTWDNDVFELFLQSDPKVRRYYEFQANARNTQFDMLIDRSGTPAVDFKSWVGRHKVNMVTAVHHRGTLNKREDKDEGWTVEGKIPWKDFEHTGGRPAQGAEWRYMASRYDFTLGKNPELSASVELTKPGGFHQPDAWETLKFVGKAGAGIPRWRNTRLVGSPEPPAPFTTKRVYAGVKSKGPKTPEHETFGPVAAKREPGAQRLWYFENFGYGESRSVMRAFDAKPDATETGLLLELKEYGYSFTFHPNFQTNGFVYLGVNGAGSGNKNHTRILRYTYDKTARKLPSESRKVIIEWPSNGHNGGDCAFGKDGMLYVTSGDGTSGMDTDKVGQDTSSLLSKVLRIDVDGAEEGETYRVPTDNPFVGVAGVAPETWAYGLRNPWRITSDLQSGQIWVGENGQDTREYAHLVGKGENYGWSAYEGSRKLFIERLKGPAPFTPPTIEHDHSLFRSLTGGIVYRGNAFPELRGAYIYGDFSTGRIWGMLHDGSRVVWHKELADTALSITGFGDDIDGELLVVDYGGGFHQLAANAAATNIAAFPKLLSETGLFADVRKLTPAPGVLPYEINVHGWHDGAQTKHWIAAPEGARVHPGINGGWNSDDGMVFAQTLSLPDGAAVKRVETRILLKQENDWTAYTYLWNTEQTDAELQPAAGRKVSLNLAGAKRDWLVPSRSDCLMCHSRQANFALTMNTRQLNRALANGTNQLQTLKEAGLIADSSEIFSSEGTFDHLPKFSNIADTKEPLEPRARTYLAVNCAHCHVSDGGGNASMILSPETKLSDTHLIDEVPLHNAFATKDSRIIAPGQPSRSVLLTRMALRIPGQMPPLGTIRPDPDGVKLLSAWISSLPRGGQTAISKPLNP